VAAHRLGQGEAYLTVREVLSEVSTTSDGVLSRERSGFCRSGFATFGLSHQLSHAGAVLVGFVQSTSPKYTMKQASAKKQNFDQV
jgi:hypothetical protein